ncbi:MAG: FAD-binding protein [Hyphomicrobiaceae bacterium]
MKALPPRHTNAFDDQFDVIVVGYGFAGAVAAISAADHGLRVLLTEKMPDPGGISICSGGGLRLAHDQDQATAYLTATNDGTTPDDVIAAFVDEMMQLDDYVGQLAQASNATLIRNERPGNYPFPGCEALYFLQIDDVPDFDPDATYPHAKALAKGTHMFKVLQDNIKLRPAITTWLESPVLRLIDDGRGGIAGAHVHTPEGTKAIKAAKGVILACGGFEAGYDLQRQFWELSPVRTSSFLGNTGDGLRMASEFGADLWHLWHFHGTYGFHHPDLPFAIRTKRLPDWIPEVRPVSAVMSWILVSADGRRFMNEYEPYLQDTGHRALNSVDFERMQQQHMPCYMIFDENGRGMYPVGQCIFNDRSVTPYTWSADNLKEVDSGLLKRADTITDAAAHIGCEAKALETTITEWNHIVESGHDLLGRPGPSMAPLSQPPFYIAEIWPVVSNTQGGPRHDTHQRIVTPFGEPIHRLYAAGEVSSIWGHIYCAGGNLTECFVGGRVAARELAGLTDAK